MKSLLEPISILVRYSSDLIEWGNKFLEIIVTNSKEMPRTKLRRGIIQFPANFDDFEYC